MYISKVYQYAVDSYGDVRTLVRGLPYQCPDDWEDILDSLDENSNLYLVKEPDNPKDELAIAAYLDDRRIGYVAASDNGKIWLYLTDEKTPCTFLERFEASFKIAFENPRSLFDNIPFEEIYRDKLGMSEQPFPKFEIPFLNNPKDNRFIWFDDKIRIVDLEKGIPDFRRKLATRMIVIVGRKNSLGEYCYYIPYMNIPISDIDDTIIQGLIDKYGFVIALPDVPMMTRQGLILMDLHVTYLKNTDYKDFASANHSEFVFSLTKDYDAKSPKTTGSQSIAGRNYNKNQCLPTDEDDEFMQNPFLTPSYSKHDYVIKEREVTDSTIDRNTFNKIDKITTDLYVFARQTLFPSTELFAFLKKHTPYYNLFYDFSQYETLIRVFVIKDLGRIYKGLNHSFNFDTTEGKPLLLYMDKEVGETTDISYEIFAQICDPKTQLEPVVKMRKVIDDFSKSFYEYDIALWTDMDFIIHSFLKDINNEWAKRYMELMRQFASVIADTNKQSLGYSSSSEKNALFSINEFFPLYGVTLGKTTWKQAEKLGFNVKVWKEGPSRYMDVGAIRFYDDDGFGVFTSFFWIQDEDDFPILWKSKGFSWELSYEEWLTLFCNLGYNVTITEKPSQSKFMGHDSLHAEFEALSPDKLLLFKMDFDYGKNGCYTTSPKTLDCIFVTYNAPTANHADLEYSDIKSNTSVQEVHDDDYYSVMDSPEGGKHVSMGVIEPEDG